MKWERICDLPQVWRYESVVLCLLFSLVFPLFFLWCLPVLPVHFDSLDCNITGGLRSKNRELVTCWLIIKEMSCRYCYPTGIIVYFMYTDLLSSQMTAENTDTWGGGFLCFVLFYFTKLLIKFLYLSARLIGDDCFMVNIYPTDLLLPFYLMADFLCDDRCFVFLLFFCRTSQWILLLSRNLKNVP